MKKLLGFFNTFFYSLIFLVIFLGLINSAYFQQVYSYLEPNLQISYKDYNLQNSSAQLIYIASNPTLFFVLEEQKPIEDKERIKSLIKESIIYNSNYKENILSTKNKVNEFISLKKPIEDQCLQYTGLAFGPCFDKDSCLKTAMTVPMASIAVYAPGFYESMIDYQKKRNDLNNATSDLLALLDEENPTKEKVQNILNKMQEVEQKVVEYNSNSLMLDRSDPVCNDEKKTVPCFEYCKKIYLPESWEEQKAKLLKTSNTLDDLKDVDNLAEQISSNTKNWLNYLNQKTRLWDSANSDLLTSIKKINSSISSSNWEDEALNQSFNSILENYEQLKKKVSEGEFYYSINKAIEIKNNLNQLLEKIEKYSIKLEAIKKSKSNIAVSLKFLEQADKTSYEKFKSELEELDKSSAYPIKVSKLEELSAAYLELEKNILVAVAKAKLNLNQTSEEFENSSAKKEEKNNSLSANQPLDTKISTPSFCQLPILAFALISLLIFLIKKK
jgi:hypothetical protein